MNRQQFIQFMQSPENLGTVEVEKLSGLVTDFPYFQTAHMLYLKALDNQNSIHYSSQLKITAAYATDRKVLYQLIAGKPVALVANEVIEEKPKTVQEEASIEIMSMELIEGDVPLSENSITPAVEESIGQNMLDRRLNTEILAEIINTTAIDDIANVPVISAGSGNESVQPKVEDDIDVTQAHSFSEWLKHTKHISGWKSESEPSISNSLIDAFITTSPKITPKKVEFYSPVNMARLSVKEDLSMVTETLAKVYVQQGNLLKAKKAYENLSLKYPEKSVYFAARIKIINEQLNSKK